MNEPTTSHLTELVRERYAAAALQVRDVSAAATADGACDANDASCCGSAALDSNGSVFGSTLYTGGEESEVPPDALLASLGCGNPTAVADLAPGETVLDLGSGGGIDVLLSARRVGPTGFAYGLDMTDEMLELARANATQANARNVEFLKGMMERIPLADATIDVVISNCVINLSSDKPAVMAEMFRVVKPGGRIGVSDVVAEDSLSLQDRLDRGSFTGCISGALATGEYVELLTAVGFTDVTVEFTHEVADRMHGAIVKAKKPLA